MDKINRTEIYQMDWIVDLPLCNSGTNIGIPTHINT